VEVEWRAFELHPEIPADGMQLPARLRARLGSMAERLEGMAHEAGLKMVTPEIVPNSRRALEAAEYARDQGAHQVFHTAVFKKLYGEGQDISRWDVLRPVAEEAGLDPDAMQRETDARKYRATVDTHIAEARALGITGVPTFIFDRKFAIVGAQSYDVFQQAMARLESDADEDPSTG
jgi:predicted DsbA family dithiol-disulfide isomerase